MHVTAEISPKIIMKHLYMYIYIIYIYIAENMYISADLYICTTSVPINE